MRVLVTGSTGLVGYEVLETLRDFPHCEVVGINRHGDADATRTVKWDLGREPPPREILGSWDVVINTAADTRWTLASDDAHQANVASVAALQPIVGDHTHVVHVSTAYAVGIHGDGSSEHIDDYRNSYEWSKAASERVARSLFPQLTIIRPPIIVGRSTDGRANRFAGMYTIVRGITASLVPAIVAENDAFFDVVPVDAVATAIVDSVVEGPAAEVQVKTIGGGEQAPRTGVAIGVILGELNIWRTENGLPPFDLPRLLSPEQWNRFFYPFAVQHLSSRQLHILDLLRNFEPYLSMMTPLRVTHTVGDVLANLRKSVRYWAATNRRVASLKPRPWT